MILINNCFLVCKRKRHYKKTEEESAVTKKHKKEGEALTQKSPEINEKIVNSKSSQVVESFILALCSV